MQYYILCTGKVSDTLLVHAHPTEVEDLTQDTTPSGEGPATLQGMDVRTAAITPALLSEESVQATAKVRLPYPLACIASSHVLRLHIEMRALHR